jgi:hypothetical protein
MAEPGAIASQSEGGGQFGLGKREKPEISPALVIARSKQAMSLSAKEEDRGDVEGADHRHDASIIPPD